MANYYGRRDYKDYSRNYEERDRDYDRERYKERSRYPNSMRDHDDESDYGSRRYNRESSGYGYDAKRDYDLGHEDASGKYMVGSEYGRGIGTSGDYGRSYYGNTDYDNPSYDMDYNVYSRNYGRRSDYRGRSSYDTRNYGDSPRDYGREYRHYGGRAGGYYGDLRDSRNRGEYDYGLSSDYDYNERGWWDRASDEVASWLGDEEAAHRRQMDARYKESHRGRGPKNYKRSDSRIEEDINDRLTYDSYLDASEIEINVENGEVTLSGYVATRNAKRRTEDIAESVSGVTNVENRLRVKQYDSGNANEGMTFADIGSAQTSGVMSGTTSGLTNKIDKTDSDTKSKSKIA